MVTETLPISLASSGSHHLNDEEEEDIGDTLKKAKEKRPNLCGEKQRQRQRQRKRDSPFMLSPPLLSMKRLKILKFYIDT